MGARRRMAAAKSLAGHRILLLRPPWTPPSLSPRAGHSPPAAPPAVGASATTPRAPANSAAAATAAPPGAAPTAAPTAAPPAVPMMPQFDGLVFRRQRRLRGLLRHGPAPRSRQARRRVLAGPPLAQVFRAARQGPLHRRVLRRQAARGARARASALVGRDVAYADHIWDGAVAGSRTVRRRGSGRRGGHSAQRRGRALGCTRGQQRQPRERSEGHACERGDTPNGARAFATRGHWRG